MAELPVTPLADYGSIMSSIPLADSTIATQSATQANTQAETRGKNIANQRAQLQIGFMKKFLDGVKPAVNDQAPKSPGQPTDKNADMSGVTDGSHPADAADPSNPKLADTGMDPAHITQHAQEQYAVRDIWTPQEIQQMQIAPMTGIPGAADMIQNTHKARIQNMTTQAQLGASQAYDNAYAVTEAPEGAALKTLARIHPDAAANIAKLATQKDWTDEQTDSFVRHYSDEVANAVHRYSGRPIEVGKDGFARDAQTGKILPGGNPEGLSASAWSELSTKGEAITTLKRSDGSEVNVPQWKADGATSLAAWVMQQAAHGRTQAEASQSSQPAVGSASAPASANAVKPVAPVGAVKPTAETASKDPLQTALNDKDYKLPTQKIQTGVSATPAALDEQKAITEKRTALLSEMSDATQAAGQSLTYIKAAKAIMDSPDHVPTGLSAATQTLISRTAQSLGITAGDWATRHQELAKALGNSALENVRARFSGGRLTQGEVNLQLKELSPESNMTPTAIKDLLDFNSKNLQYGVDTAKRANAYLAAGNDPRKFGTWNQHYFPHEDAVSESKKAMPPAEKLKAYADKHFGGDTTKASAFLKKQGYQ